MARKRVGTCHICGTHGPLSFEHVPPRAAFNDRPTVGFAGQVLLDAGLTPDPSKGRISQRGSGAYTLCGTCNNNTGAWYGKHFVEWCYQGMQILVRAEGRPTLIYMNYLFPLAILKQIITMFFSVNSPRFREAQPYLEQFVMDRQRKYLPPKMRVYAYYTLTGTSRAAGVSGLVNLETGQVRILSEISFPPFGYLLTFDSAPPDPRLVDITHFASFDYGEFAVLNIQLPVLETNLPLPGDYRTRAEIEHHAGRKLPF